ncbi:dTDP-4-dehydrorhamnose reductase [Winogradskyella haliclonae]|nr:dTDP-4-dehydrorhamnose reductase [Winogradskyella haliclonae]
MSVLVIGKDSQLAQCIMDCEKNFPEIDFSYKDSKELDITDEKSVKKIFEDYTFNYCINCAAYTNVDKAETEPLRAKTVNTIGAQNIARACKVNGSILIHISTDFVFDGEKKTPYIEEDYTNPINVYGKTKRDGELEIEKTLEKYFIIRTSWLYSQKGSNFLKTILRIAKERKEISVVNDQFGSPTYALDLAHLTLKIISSKSNNYGTYHYSNLGKISWYDFALEISKTWKLDLKINPIKAKDYITHAVRPSYSVLDSSKAQKSFNIKAIKWNESLQKCFLNYN